MSFVYQVTSISDLEVHKVAEIGVGPGVVRGMMKSTYPDCEYTTIDIDPALAPDICASVTDLPVEDKAYDALFCCQVLEHLPYEQFDICIRELCRVTKKRLIVSLPDVSPFFYLRVYKGRRLLGPLWKGLSLPNLFPAEHDISSHGQHYWEIGAKGYRVSRIIKDLEKNGAKVIDHFRMTERNYWHFFLLEPGK